MAALPVLASLALLSASPPTADVVIVQTATGQRLELDDGTVLHTTARSMEQAVLVEVPPARLVTWTERDDTGTTPMYCVSPKGVRWTRGREAKYEITLRSSPFNPLAVPDEVPVVDGLYSNNLVDNGQLYFVQYLTPSLPIFREELSRRGAEPVRHFPWQADIVLIQDPQDVPVVGALPFVRWVGRYRPEYRLQPEFVSLRLSGSLGVEDVVIRAREPGAAFKGPLLDRILNLGGVVGPTVPEGHLLRATLTPDQLLLVSTWDEVLSIDRAGRARSYGYLARGVLSPVVMDLVRADGGADHLEDEEGLLGDTVSIEIADGGVYDAHPDLPTPEFHDSNGDSIEHGTAMSGIVFGSGTENPEARGLLPEGKFVFAAIDPHKGLLDRYGHTKELLLPPFECVAQSCSWGLDSGDYSNDTVELDEVAFALDLLIVQALGNYSKGDQLAWAKNVLTVGAVQHNDTPEQDDDLKIFGPSATLAPDGRVKPDLCYWGDSILTTSTVTARAGLGPIYVPSYATSSGTSPATAEVAGYVGLLHQMWQRGLAGSAPSEESVFASRPHSTTARALLINSAAVYEFDETTTEIGREEQGWGRPNLTSLYDRRSVLHVIDESVVLEIGEVAQWTGEVPTGTPSLRVTLVFPDPAGAAGAAVHRVNDLSVRVTDPGGAEYWGNYGLEKGPWSIAGGDSDTLDVVENVFVQNPLPGTWSFEVFADEINEDGNLETATQDADFALVVCGTRALEEVVPEEE